MGNRHHARGAMNVNPDKLAMGDSGRTRMDPHPHSRRLAVRPLTSRQLALCPVRTQDCLSSPSKDREERIPRDADHAAASGLDRPPHHTMVLPDEVRIALPQPLQHQRRALNIGEEHRYARPSHRQWMILDRGSLGNQPAINGLQGTPERSSPPGASTGNLALRGRGLAGERPAHSPHRVGDRAGAEGGLLADALGKGAGVRSSAAARRCSRRGISPSAYS
jgi:hypothetical protein